MKKRVKIVLWILGIIVLLGVGFYLWYQSLDFNDDGGESVTCGCSHTWKCPDSFLEENGIDLDDYFRGELKELPEGGREAGCVGEWICWPCNELLN